MLIKTICCHRYDEEYSDTDVYIQGEDGSIFIVNLTTPQNLQELMDNYKINEFGKKYRTNYIPPGIPTIIVRNLTREVILETIMAYSEDDGYWLQLHHFAADIDPTVFKKLQAKLKEELEDDYDEEDEFEYEFDNEDLWDILYKFKN